MKLRYGLAACLGVAAAIPAAADASITINSPIAFNPVAEYGTIHYAPGGIGGNAATNQLYVDMGRFSFSTSVGTIVAYCIDILHYISPGTFDIDPVSMKITNLTKANQIVGLLTHADSMIATAGTADEKSDIAAAIQMSIWEIEYETGFTGYSLTDASSQFWVTGADSGAMSYAVTFLANAAGTNGTNGGWYGAASGLGANILYNANNQSQIFIIAVPEPATWGMMIGGFALVGGSLRAARKRKLRAFA